MLVEIFLISNVSPYQNISIPIFKIYIWLSNQVSELNQVETNTIRSLEEVLRRTQKAITLPESNQKLAYNLFELQQKCVENLVGEYI